MKRSLMLAGAVSLLAASALADPGHGRGHDKWDRDAGPPGLANRSFGLPPGQAKKLWRRGERIPVGYIGPRYYIVEPRRYHLHAPSRGYRWVVVDHDAYLVAVTSGLVAEVVAGAIADSYDDDHYGPPPPVDREDRWRRRYARTYSVNDDSFYRDCRRSADPAGVIGGALIGGLLGNAASHGRAGATVAGVVIGGAVGAAMTSHLQCEDRSYAYKTYSDAFNAGRPDSVYEWRNPENNHYGTFRVGGYYDDPDGFRCANFTQRIFVDGRPQAASGRACQQPDGTWAIVG